MSATWELPPAEATGKVAVVRTGPSGLLLGKSGRGAEVAIRLFRSQGTRLLLDVPDYAKWLVAFRAACLGAHLTIISEDHRNWRSLARVVGECGGTVDLLRTPDGVPGAGRPYRPSLVIDDAASFNSNQFSPGPWQAVAVVESVSAGSSVHSLRNSDMALIGQADSKAMDNLKRAYVLNTQQLKLFENLGNAVVLTMARRAVRVDFPPTKTEYRLLFNV